MRKIIFLAIITLLIFTGCTNTANKSSKKQQNPPKSPADSISYTAQISELKAPDYFIPQSMTPNGLLFGQAGSKLISLNPHSGQAETLIENVWSGYISPDGNKVAFTNESGLQVRYLDQQETSKIALPQNEMSTSAIFGTWSPDSGRFIYMIPYEWSSDYYIYDLAQDTSSQFEFKNAANFLSLPVNWSNDRIAFIVSANTSKSGEQEYREAGYRSDLFFADSDGNFNQLTGMDDNCFVEFGGITTDSKKILLIVNDLNSNLKRAGILSPSNKKIEYLSENDKNIATASISPEGNLAATVVLDGSGQFKFELYDLQTTSRFFSHDLDGSEAPQYYIWSKTRDQTVLYFGQRNDGASYKLYSVTIQEQVT